MSDALAGSMDVKHNENVIFTVHDLTPGSYVFWCTIVSPDGNTHANRGMQGTLTITGQSVTAVPEPATLTLTAFSIAGLVARARRSRRSRIG